MHLYNPSVFMRFKVHPSGRCRTKSECLILKNDVRFCQMLLPDVLCCSLQRESICPGMPCSHQPGVKLFSSMTLWCDCEGRIQASDTTLQDSSMTSTSNTGEGPVGRSGPWMTMESLMDFFLPPNTGKTYSLQPTSRRGIFGRL